MLVKNIFLLELSGRLYLIFFCQSFYLFINLMIRFTSMFFNLNFWGRQYIVVVSPAFTRNVTHPYMVVNFAFST